MKDKICLITGANTGIGRAAALSLAKMGAVIVINARNEQKGNEALKSLIKETGNNNIFLLLADLSSQAQVKTLAAEFRKRFNKLDVLINNAGIITRERTETGDGYEYQLAVNHLAPFLLTNLLIDLLIDSAPSKIINVSSLSHKGASIDFNDLQGTKEYNPVKIYSRTKLMNILFTYKLAKMLKGTGVTVNAVNPGGVGTNLWADYKGLPRFFSILSKIKNGGPEKGAQTIIYLASSPEAENVTGKYFENKKEAQSSAASYDSNSADKLWEISSQLTGILNPQYQ